MTGNETSKLTDLVHRVRRFLPRPSVAVHHMSLEHVLVDASQCLANAGILFRHPTDITASDLESVFADAAYDHRSGSIGYASIAAACLWSAWAMPAGGVFVLLFKQIALPAFGVYAAARSLDSHLTANGAERIAKLIQNGACDFTEEADSLD